MQRLQRLHAIVEHLRGRRVAVPVSELAERFGVTERTIFRDLADLRGNEVPIDSAPGPAGGIHLGRDYTLPPIGLAIDEAVALWIAVQLRGGLGGEPLRAALDKVVGGLSSTNRTAFDRRGAYRHRAWSVPRPCGHRTPHRPGGLLRL